MERLWKINRTLVEKLETTGYLVPDEEREAVQSLENFQVRFPSTESMERVFQPQPNTAAMLKSPSGVLIFFSDAPEGKKQITVDEIRRLIDKMEELNTTTCYLIISSPLSTIAQKALASAQAPDLARVVVFQAGELTFNITKHRRVPKHHLLSPKEAKEWLTATKLRRSQIPRIFETDPQAKFLDAVSGELIKVVGPSPTVGTYARHLVVVRRLVR
jgi:DNA-directed RNA polymerase subunit H